MVQMIRITAQLPADSTISVGVVRSSSASTAEGMRPTSGVLVAVTVVTVVVVVVAVAAVRVAVVGGRGGGVGHW